MFIQEWSQLLIMRYYQNNIHNHCSWMQADTPSINMNLPLTQNQIQICGYAEQFISSNNPKSEQALKKFHWTDICAVITHPNISNNIITVCCSTLKLLVKYEKFLDDPMTVFKYLCEFYFQNLDPQQNPLSNVTKAQELTQMVIKVIPSACLKQAQKQHLIQQFLKVLNTNIQKSVRILKILTLIAEEIEIQRINNQKFVGQLLLFLEKIIKQKSSQENIPFKLLVITQTIKLIQVILDLVNEQDEIQQNYVEQFLTNSKLAKNILEQIISEGSNGKQIITNDNQINEVKFKTLELYSSIWVYSLDDSIFLLFLSSLLHAPAKLVDFQANIMEKIVVMLQRSVNNQIYYPYFHKNQQQITISLLSFLMPKQSYLQKIQKQPEYFVEILSDFCMEQQQELFETRVGSLLSALCLYIDGYMSFVGSLCIMMIKQFNGTVHTLPDVQGYIDTINLLWVCSDEQKIVTCVLVLCAISDQLQKRQDLLIPLRKQLFEMSYMFKYPDCQLPPILICRFMFLYAFNAYPGCLNVFLPYKDVKSVYESQLQACYTIMKRYYNKHKECKQYIDQIGEIIIVSNELSPLLQTSIMTGQMTSKLQFQILQRLVLWMQSSIQMSDRIKQSKYANLISKLIERLEVVDYNQTEEAVFTYLQSLFKIVLTKDGSDSEQFILEISVAFVKRFPSLEKSPQRLLTLVEMGFKIVERNNGVLNSCLDLFYQLTRYLPKQLVESLINIYLGCLQSQDREEDNWQCYYGLESCFIRLNELKAPTPHINVNNILVKTREYSKILVIKAYMAIYSIIIANPENRQNCECLQNRQLPEQIPPYENKPYCLYLLSMAPYLNMTFEYSNWYLHLILKLMKNQKQINSSIRKYEQMIYNNYQNHHQFIVHAYTISRNVLHPLLLKNIDIYNQFRKFWWKFPHRQQLMHILDQSTLQYITELCTQTTINYKVRKIYKVKPQQNNQQMQDELTTKTNTEMQ